jgi:hypothetical protein
MCFVHNTRLSPKVGRISICFIVNMRYNGACREGSIKKV